MRHLCCGSIVSDYERTYAAALQELEAKNIKLLSDARQVLWLYRGVGLKVRPPHYANFPGNALGQGLFFGVILGGGFWLLEWLFYDPSLQNGILFMSIAGVLFGGVMALSYAFVRKVRQLSNWDDL